MRQMALLLDSIELESNGIIEDVGVTESDNKDLHLTHALYC